MNPAKFGIILLLLAAPYLSAQDSFINDPAALEQAHKCINSIYNFSFEEATKIQHQLILSYPEHPAPYFLEGLIIYWKNFPLTPDNQISEKFIEKMNLAIDKAEILIETDSLYMEGLFFNLFGRAFKAMYWADNGKPGKIISDLRTMYSNTIEGFGYMDRFKEFYFSCGLYNYYIEAYAELHPVYKPVISFMREGDRDLGLLQLKFAIDNTTFLKVEALLFMTLIQLNYELDLDSASRYAEQLHNAYPDNTYYRGLYITILLHLENFNKVEKILLDKKVKNDSYSLMINLLAKGFMVEHTSSELNIAKKYYEESLEISDKYGDYGNIYRAMAYMGLSRISGRENNESLRRKYLHMAEDNTSYAYIISRTSSEPLPSQKVELN